MNSAIIRTGARRRHRVVWLSALAALTITSCGDSDADEESGVATTVAAPAASATTATAPTASATAPASTEGAAETASNTGGTGSGSTGDIEDYIDQGAEAFEFGNEDERRCLSSAIIDAIGADAVLATGLSPEEFIGANTIGDAGIEVDDEMQERAQSGIAECGDLVEMIAASASEEQQATCFRDAFTDDLVAEQIAVSLFAGTSTAELSAAGTAVTECLAE